MYLYYRIYVSVFLELEAHMEKLGFGGVQQSGTVASNLSLHALLPLSAICCGGREGGREGGGRREEGGGRREGGRREEGGREEGGGREGKGKEGGRKVGEKGDGNRKMYTLNT